MTNVKMTRSHEGSFKSLAMMEEDFRGAKGDRKKKMLKKLSPKILETRYMMRKKFKEV